MEIEQICNFFRKNVNAALLYREVEQDGSKITVVMWLVATFLLDRRELEYKSIKQKAITSKQLSS